MSTDADSGSEAGISRQMYATLEPLHAMAYFIEEVPQELAPLGLEGRAQTYFPSRAAPLGRVPQEVVTATFFVFSPLAVAFGMSEAWNKTSPEAVLEAKQRAIDAALRRLCGDLLDAPGIPEAVELARTAAAGCLPPGRPLAASYAALPEPEAPHLALWHHVAVVREFRGDGHLAALLTAGLDAPQALVLQAARYGPSMKKFLKATRGWSPEEWDAAAAALQQRGWIDADGAFTDQGRAAREEIEATTDRLALPAWEALGREGTERLRELVQPLSDAIVAGGGMPVSRKG